ncbi:hypothetical protein C8F04DRAFT_530489 [Mycena alexandri]|uniref:Uncharacterized protein n=1 Tax=Mycena alexandri TaxID=1745969 RepID=A0AAD6SWP6_9AGAR|nr:hypothetical protein C8F04DRAFT_530489 [Mycena alexandri]
MIPIPSSTILSFFSLSSSPRGPAHGTVFLNCLNLASIVSSRAPFHLFLSVRTLHVPVILLPSPSSIPTCPAFLLRHVLPTLRPRLLEVIENHSHSYHIAILLPGPCPSDKRLRPSNSSSPPGFPIGQRRSTISRPPYREDVLGRQICRLNLRLYRR